MAEADAANDQEPHPQEPQAETPHDGVNRTSPRPQHGTTATTKRKRPGHHLLSTHQRSQLGNQCESLKRSAPQFSFNSGDRFCKEHKLYLSPEHLKHVPHPDGPGPGEYAAVGTIEHATQRLASRLAATSQELTFGTERRFFLQTCEQKRTQAMPDPGVYKTALPLGRQYLSNRTTAPTASMGASKRHRSPQKGFELEFYGTESPGPVYNHKLSWRCPSALIMQPTTCHSQGPSFVPRNSCPGPGAYSPELPSSPKRASALKGIQPGGMFGASDRTTAAMASLPERQARSVLAGLASPGAAAYYCDNLSKDSRRKNPGNAVFGKSTRFPPIKSSTPGPGTYPN